MRSYRDYIVWQKSKALVTEVYLITKNFPREEIHGLTFQVRRSAVSIPSNIAEGYGRRSNADFLRFLRISSGSLYELETQLEIAHDLGYVDRESITLILKKTREIEKMLCSLISKIEENK